MSRSAVAPSCPLTWPLDQGQQRALDEDRPQPFTRGRTRTGFTDAALCRNIPALFTATPARHHRRTIGASNSNAQLVVFLTVADRVIR